jgi:lipoprotein-releasing system permease protein
MTVHRHKNITVTGWNNRSIGLLTRRLLTDRHGKITGRHWLTFSGIALGVFALLTVSTVMNGFDRDMRQRIIGTRAEIRVDNKDASPLVDYTKLISSLEKHPAVKAASPVVRNELMLVKGSAMAATVCFGIDLERHRRVSPVLLPLSQEQLNQADKHWVQGIVNGSPQTGDLEHNGIIIGSELALNLGVVRGDTLALISPLGTVPTPLGLLPRTRQVVVVGIFVAGMPEYDRLYSYISLENGQFFSGYGNQADHIDLKTNHPNRLFKNTHILQAAFPAYRVQNWSAFDSSLFNAMHFEKFLMLTVLSLMFVIAAFNMSGNIYRSIVLKRRTIGVLKTVGFRNSELVRLFFGQGLLVTLAGIVTGILAALVFIVLQASFDLIQLPVGNMPNLIIPVHPRIADFVVIPLAALLISSLSIWLPARKAASIDPIRLIRETV